MRRVAIDNISTMTLSAVLRGELVRPELLISLLEEFMDLLSVLFEHTTDVHPDHLRGQLGDKYEGLSAEELENGLDFLEDLLR